jgi:hypothetical protein
MFLILDFEQQVEVVVSPLKAKGMKIIPCPLNSFHQSIFNKTRFVRYVILMAWIYSSTNFVVESAESPLVDREDGGHITITPLQRRTDIQGLAPHEAVELMRLMIVTGQALTNVLTESGVEIGRVNYQENGNWGVFSKDGPYQHMHIYGRSRTSRYQPFGEACYFPSRTENPPFYEPFRPLSPKDVESIRSEIVRLLRLDKYDGRHWSLNEVK